LPIPSVQFLPTPCIGCTAAITEQIYF
jgi:hypothetical protein